jgi:hypothetical protein
VSPAVRLNSRARSPVNLKMVDLSRSLPGMAATPSFPSGASMRRPVNLRNVRVY